eukprot:4826598-Prymnesium_polylepis.1
MRPCGRNKRARARPLCPQLITGYKLRELEAKEELERSLQTDEADEADEEGDGDGEPASESE